MNKFIKNNVQIAAVSSRDQSLAATGITSGDSMRLHTSNANKRINILSITSGCKDYIFVPHNS